MEFDIPPLSFFIMDNRTHRGPRNHPSLMGNTLRQFETWAERVAQDRYHGVIVTGQLLTEEAADERATDYSLANYSDYPKFVEGIDQIRAGGGSVLLITGDKHWGASSAARRLLGWGPYTRSWCHQHRWWTRRSRIRRSRFGDG